MENLNEKLMKEGFKILMDNIDFNDPASENKFVEIMLEAYHSKKGNQPEVRVEKNGNSDNYVAYFKDKV